MRYGLTLIGEAANLDYNLSYASHSGTIGDNDRSGNMLDFKLGYSLPNIMNLRFYLGYHSDSGADGNADNGEERYDSFHYDFHGNAGEMDVLQWGNLGYTNLGFTLDPTEEITLGAAYFMFKASDEMDHFHALDGDSKGISTTWRKAEAGNADLGTELDFWVAKKYEESFSISVTYSQFSPGQYFAMADGKAYSAYSQFFIEGNLRLFKLGGRGLGLN